MSRVGSKAITVPGDVKVTINNNIVTVNGPLGQLTKDIDSVIEIAVNDNLISLTPKKKDNNARSKWGLYRALINNMVVGVKEGYKKVLEIKGVGYKANVKDGFLTLSLGYSHDVKMEIPENVDVSVVKATTIELSSYDKESLGLFASNIKKLRLPEPYKGKGVKYLGEFIVRKEGKK